MADRRLLVWALASFHAAGFTLGVVLPAYVSGGLSDVLPAFGTLPGFLGYGYLWGLSYLATRWALAGDALADEALEETLSGSVRSVLLRGIAAGGLVGMAALLGPLLLVSIPDLMTGSGDPTSFVLILAIGLGVSGVVGAAVGLVLAAVDLVAFRAAGALRPDGDSGPPPAGGDGPPPAEDDDGSSPAEDDGPRRAGEAD